ncbi:MAG: hypothetical protein K8I30_09035 [Anaerolineae bacterium]|nr:hypothetical protein [Anaerolineae bacterium]
MNASTNPDQGNVYLDQTDSDDEILAKILNYIAAQGGPVLINIPMDE